MGCPEEKHDWREVYYGWQCRRCGQFVAFGCEPWALPDEDEPEHGEEPDGR